MSCFSYKKDASSFWREKNDSSFDDRERTLEEFLSFFFNALYLWTMAFVSSLVLNFHDFLGSFFSF
jgi:hypothetical protein